MPSKPSCCTVTSCRTFSETARTARSRGQADLVRGLVDQSFRASRHPRVEPPLGKGNGELLAVPGQDPGVAVQGQDVRADRAELAGKVVEAAVVRNRPAAADDVAGEQRAEFLAVQDDRTRAVSRRVDHLERDVGDLEDAALLNLDV